MPLMMAGRPRKVWRWQGAFGDQMIVFAAVVRIGPIPARFWGILDRLSGRLVERSSKGSPFRRPEVEFRGDDLIIGSDLACANLEFGDAIPIEVFTPAGPGPSAYTWTRKRCGMEVSGEVAVGEPTRSFEGRGVIDESAGYHDRRTSWRWSAGVGESVDGREVAWNLVEGINSSPTHSERTVWLDGLPREVGPVGFEGLETVVGDDGERLAFVAEAQRSRKESVPPLVSSEYRAPLGTFSGTVGGIELRSGIGVMESHEAVW
jgi:hypothetical protein